MELETPRDGWSAMLDADGTLANHVIVVSASHDVAKRRQSLSTLS